mmetsp:Transcript_24884/g.98833  ORF Transcript_24884/g.98833 Transcript_24884/m.98833 type:complete len:255 (+) Transcript_24884:878-1642(+)
MADLASGENDHHHGHGHDGHHHHDHEDDHEGEHLTRYETEKRANERQTSETPGERLVDALFDALRANGHVDVEEFRAAVEGVERLAAPLGPEAIGPRVVARAWKNPDFMRRLVDDAHAAILEEFDVAATNATAPTKLVAVANTADKHHLAVCTLCSCYPITVLGLSPAWYKDVSYRARAVRRPRSLLRTAFGLDIPDDVAITVVDSTADCRYMVIPAPPDNVDVAATSEADLATFVTRDSMIGVGRAAAGPATS